MEDDMNIFRMNIMRGGGYENTSNYVHRLGGVDFAFRSARGHNGSAGFDLVYAYRFLHWLLPDPLRRKNLPSLFSTQMRTDVSAVRLLFWGG